MTGLLSVIVPVFNGEHFLEFCLDSLKTQHYSNMEVLMIDDGSTDKSPEICAAFADSDSRFLYIRKENGGVSSARNLGLKRARGEWIAFADADDKVEAEIYTCLAGELEKGADLAVCGFYSGEEKPAGSRFGAEELSGEGALRKLFTDYGFQMAIWNKLYRREIIEAGKLTFDEDLTHGEDGLFLCRYLCRCKRVARIREPLYYYRLTEDSAMRRAAGFNPQRLKALEADQRMVKATAESGRGRGTLQAARAHAASTAVGLMAAAMDGGYWEEEVIRILKAWIREYLTDFCRESAYSVPERLYGLTAGLAPGLFRFLRRRLCKPS